MPGATSSTSPVLGTGGLSNPTKLQLLSEYIFFKVTAGAFIEAKHGAVGCHFETFTLHLH